jgi:hypothetical protein
MTNDQWAMTNNSRFGSALLAGFVGHWTHCSLFHDPPTASIPPALLGGGVSVGPRGHRRSRAHWRPLHIRRTPSSLAMS